MKKFLWLIPAVFLFLTAAYVTADSGSKGDPEKGKAAFEEYCVKCHDLQRSLSRTKDRDGWEKTVERMSNYHKKFGGPIPEEAEDDIIAYLTGAAGGK